MEEIFKIVEAPEKEGREEREITLGIQVKLGGHEIFCPVTKSCHSYKALEIEAQVIKDHIDKVVSRAKAMYDGGPTKQGGLQLKPGMSPEEIWGLLSAIDDLNAFINSFNDLDEEKRKGVAEHVLTRCNVFSGKASIFSSRYNNESGFLE